MTQPNLSAARLCVCVAWWDGIVWWQANTPLQYKCANCVCAHKQRLQKRKVMKMEILLTYICLAISLSRILSKCATQHVSEWNSELPLCCSALFFQPRLVLPTHANTYRPTASRPHGSPHFYHLNRQRAINILGWLMCTFVVRVVHLHTHIPEVKVSGQTGGQ